MTTFTTNYALTKSLIGGRTDLWGQDIHDSYDIIDAQMKLNADAAANASSLTSGTLPIDRIADGTVTNVKLASDLNASKLTVGTLPDARLSANVPLTESAVVTLGGDFVGTGNLTLVKVGKLVTAYPTTSGLNTLASEFEHSSNSGVIPVAFRPPVPLSFVVRTLSTTIASVEVSTSGVLRLNYRNYSGGSASSGSISMGAISWATA